MANLADSLLSLPKSIRSEKTKQTDVHQKLLYKNSNLFSSKMGVRKKQNFFCYKRNKDIVDHPYEAASFIDMMRYASTIDWCLVGTGILFSLLTGIPYALHCYNFGGICNALVEGQFNYVSGTFDISDFNTKVMVYIWRFFFIGVAEFVFVFITMISFYSVCERQLHEIKKNFFQAILNQDMPWFDKNEVGALTQKMNLSFEKINSGMSDKCAIILQAISNIIIGVLAGFFICWQMTLLLVLLSPFMSFSMFGPVYFTGDSLRKEMEAYASAGGVAEEVISGIRTVAAFTAQRFEAQRYESFLKLGKKMGVRKAMVVGYFSGLFLFMIFGCMSIAFWYGTTLVLNGTMLSGMVFGVFWLIIDGAVRLGTAIPQISVVSAAKLAAGELFSIIDRRPALDCSNSKGTKLKNIEGKVEFSNVHFKYPTRPDVKVLRGISFVANPGETVALIGHSGCGKSTIVCLLMRYYECSQGSLTIDGVTVEELNVEWLRNTIGVVSQQPVLFATTVEENLKLGKEHATLEDMIQACKTANAHDFISKLPQGYHTLIGEGGVKLSGGQKQRLAIARALIRNPKILLLDEATSALDTESELKVQQAINQASAGRTTITIAHRLSTIRNANKILVVADGQIVESGTHEQLHQLDGVYRQLLNAQDISSGLEELKKDEEAEFSDDELGPRQHARRREFSHSSSRDSTREFADLARANDAIRSSMTSLKPAVEYGDFRCLDQSEKQEKKASILEIIRFCKAEYHLLLPGLLFTLLRGFSWPVFAILYGRSFQTLADSMGLSSDEVTSQCLINSIYFLVLGILAGLTTFGSGALFGIVGEKMSMRLRMKVFKNILRQDGAYFDCIHHSTGKLTSRLATDAPNVQAAIDHRLAQVVQGWVSLIVGLFVAFYFGWNVALFGVAIMLTLVFAQFIIAGCMKRMGIKIVKLSEESSNLYSEAIENVRTVQALTKQRVLYEKFCEILKLPHQLAFKQGLWQSLTYALSSTFFNFNFAASYFCGVLLIEWGYATPFTVFQVIESLTMASFTLMMTAAYMPEYLRARISAGLMFSMVEEQPKIDSDSKLGKVSLIAGNLAINDVHFAYPNGTKRLVLNGLSLNANFGQTLALVGPSGCGKSTIMQLIERYYEVLSGNLFIDGVDLRQYNVKHLRQAMSIVGQEPTLFNLTIKQNIAYGMEEEVTQKQVEEAAKLANIHTFVESLPEKYQTSCDGKGTQLSGGQRQRIAIARAIIRDPKILLLDEATSALDTESEKLVQEALERAKQGRTCVVIAHRLSTIQHADMIAVIKDGRVVEQGNHQNLVMKKGVYQKLVENQSK